MEQIKLFGFSKCAKFLPLVTLEPRTKTKRLQMMFTLISGWTEMIHKKADNRSSVVTYVGLWCELFLYIASKPQENAVLVLV